jgi:hypothetical protein
MNLNQTCTRRTRYVAWWIALTLGYSAAALADASPPMIPGKLFYTPAERAMLNDARLHKITELQQSSSVNDSIPLSFDGVVIRSDGRSTHWINGAAHNGRTSAAIRRLKPGQIRDDNTIYEPYQVLRGNAATPPPTIAPPAEPGTLP